MGVGDPILTVGLVPFVPMLLTIKDGQGVASEVYAAVRVIILSGTAEGQDVPQGAVTVDFNGVSLCSPLRLNDGQKKGAIYLGICANSRESKSCEDELHAAEVGILNSRR